MRQRDLELNDQWGTICTPVEMLAAGSRRCDVGLISNDRLSVTPYDGIVDFQIITSIPSV